jgi:DNA-binding MarR family transcriptional regulator
MIQDMNDSASEQGCFGAVPIPRCAAGHLALLLSFAGTAILDSADERLSVVGLTGREYSILSILETDGPGSQQELARLLGKVPAMVVSAVDALEQRGLVARTRDPADRRRSRVTLTDVGAHALEQAHAVADATVAELFGGLDADELRQLTDLMTRGLGLDGERVGAAVA